MKKHYYHEIIDTDEIHTEIEGLELETEQISGLKVMAEETVFLRVLNVTLENLPEGEKEQFLNHLHERDHDSLWSHLREHAENIEEEIKLAYDDVKNTLMSDLKGN